MNRSELVESFNGKIMNEKDSNLNGNGKITLDSMYSNTFHKDEEARKQRKRGSLKGEDNINFKGPFQNITSYGAKYPGVFGSNPYVRFSIISG